MPAISTSEVAMWLGRCVGLFFGCLLAWRLLRRRLRSIAARAGSLRWRSKGHSKYAPIWFALFCGIVLSYGAVKLSRENIVTAHHVAVLRQLDNGDWAMRSDEDASLVFRPCSDDVTRGVDVNGLLTQGIGYIADYARWDERGTCKSILRSDLGFWFKDAATNYEYRRIN